MSLVEEMEAEAAKLEAVFREARGIGLWQCETLARRIRDWVEVLREKESEQTS